MKPARFVMERPRDLAAALSMIADADGATKIMAGGQSLGPMLNLRLVEPDRVIDISGVPELRRIDRTDGSLVIGACVTHADIEDGRVPDVANGMMARVAAGIAYRAVRNRGTIGGSLAHADPAADWVSALSALGAEVEIASPARNRRRVAIGEFVLGALDVALAPDELVTAICVPVAALVGALGLCQALPQGRRIRRGDRRGRDRPGARLRARRDRRGRGGAGGDRGCAHSVRRRHRPVFRCALRRLGRRIALLAAAGMSDPVDRHIHVTVLRRAVTQASVQGPAKVQDAA